MSHKTSLRRLHRGRAASTAGIVPRECFQKLSGCPFGCRVGGHSEMHRTSPIMAKNHEGEQELKSDGWHDKEVYGDQVLGVVFEKGSPRLGGRLLVPDHVLGDRCLRLNTEFQEFAMNTRSSPSRVGEAHLTDQIANFRR